MLKKNYFVEHVDNSTRLQNYLAYTTHARQQYTVTTSLLKLLLKGNLIVHTLYSVKYLKTCNCNHVVGAISSAVCLQSGISNCKDEYGASNLLLVLEPFIINNTFNLTKIINVEYVFLAPALCILVVHASCCVGCFCVWAFLPC